MGSPTTILGRYKLLWVGRRVAAQVIGVCSCMCDMPAAVPSVTFVLPAALPSIPSRRNSVFPSVSCYRLPSVYVLT
jgi:hypothetical protein